jgi:2-keto-4-pentenoate hydratase/2-oxohepta-3-ene-1,7-dioic acid hydratase in catechol pathway
MYRPDYRDHVKELNNPVPEKPVFFMKPDSSLLMNDKPFFLPDFSGEIHHEIEIVLRICRLGKKIATSFASRYYDMVTVGIDFTARDLQRQCIKNGNPWEIAKGFDQSAVVGRFVDVNTLPDRSAVNFSLDINGSVVQQEIQRILSSTLRK